MKDYALTLLRIASSLFPPIANLLDAGVRALAGSPDEGERTLAREVRAILPEKSETRKALDEMAGEEG